MSATDVTSADAGVAAPVSAHHATPHDPTSRDSTSCSSTSRDSTSCSSTSRDSTSCSSTGATSGDSTGAISGSPSYRVLLAAIADLSRVQREVTMAIARDLECPRAGLGIIRVLERVGDSGVGDLAHHLRVDISVASRQVGALVDAGLVERAVPDAPGVDRRTRSVRLTPAGAAFAARTSQVIDMHATSAFESWPPDEIAAASEQLHKVAAAIAAAQHALQADGTHLETSAPS